MSKKTNEKMSVGKRLLLFAGICWALAVIYAVSDPKYILVIALASPVIVTVIAGLQSLLGE